MINLGLLFLALLAALMIAGFVFVTVLGIASVIGIGVSLLLLPFRIIVWALKGLLWIFSSIF